MTLLDWILRCVFKFTRRAIRRLASVGCQILLEEILDTSLVVIA